MQVEQDPAAERYAYLRLQQLVRAGVLPAIPHPGAGGYSALWRQYSPQAVQAAHHAGVQDTSQFLRQGGVQHAPAVGPQVPQHQDIFQNLLQHQGVPQSPLGAVQRVSPNLAPFEVAPVHNVPLATGPRLFGTKFTTNPKSAVLAKRVSSLDVHPIGGVSLGTKLSAALKLANKGWMG